MDEPLPVELMNTVRADRDGVHDTLATPEQALTWLRAVRDRIGPRPAAVDAWLAAAQPGDAAEAIDHLRRVRDGLRRLAAEATRDPRTTAAAPPDRDTALRTLGDACAAAPTWSSLQWTEGQGPHRRVHGDAPPGHVLVALLAEQGIALLAEHADLLRACRAPGCVLYFVAQHPRREWCSAGCGNRARVARHYRRHRVGGRP